MHLCMNWASLGFDWNQARAFLVTAEEGSFSAAARALGLTQPTLGRQVAGLEEALDVVLFERIGRRLELTPAGRDVLDHFRAMGEAALSASLAATGRSEAVSGEVAVSVTDIFASYTMPYIAKEFRLRAPQIMLRVRASNALSDLQRREADIAVRHVAPKQPDLIARKVREAKGRLYASRAYLDRFGPITVPEDVARADFIGIGEGVDMLPFLHKWGLPVSVDNLKLTGESGIFGWEAARQGLGLVPMSDDLAWHFPEMVVVLPELKPIPVPYWLTVHRELHSSKRIRLVYDFLAEVLSRKVLPGAGQ